MDNKIDIIMATHNNLGMTMRAVTALYENTNVDFRLTVVDDSVDMTPDYFRQLQRRVNNIQYIRPFDESYEVIPPKITHGNQIINIGLKPTTPKFSFCCINARAMFNQFGSTIVLFPI